MMFISLDENIKLCVLLYPSLFLDPYMEPSLWPISRRKVLSHMFLTLGNGYDWNEEGCLDELDYYKRRKPTLLKIRKDDSRVLLRLRKKIAKEYCSPRQGQTQSHYPLREDGLFDFNQSHLDYLSLLAGMRECLEESADRTFESFRPYPISAPGQSIGTLAEIPDNIQPDYLEGVFEILQDVVDLPLLLSKGYKVEEQKEAAALWITHLRQRFPTMTPGYVKGKRF